jgi:K+-transporting ATPase KdpF subunit
VFRPDVPVHRSLRSPLGKESESAMGTFIVIVASATSIYLVYALIRPEKF